MQIVNGLIAIYNHPEFPALFKPQLAQIIAGAYQPNPSMSTFVGFKTLQGTWLTREVDRFPKCAN